MRYQSTSAVLLLAALLVCVASAGYAVTLPPSTDGWFLTPTVDGDNINLFLGVDNMDALANYNGLVSRTWGDPTGSDPSKYLELGNGAFLQSMTVRIDADPRVSVEFYVVAGPTGGLFTLTSDVVSFANLASCDAAATAALTVTDRDGDGAMATGGYDNGCFYQAIYNDTSTFCYLIQKPMSTAGYCSDTSKDNVPPWVPMNDIYNISAQFKFHLSPNDSASGTSNFVVVPVPEPSAMLSLLTGVVGLVGFVRRRRRA